MPTPFSTVPRAATSFSTTFLALVQTILAAEKVGRVCHAVEIDPLYVDAAVKRWERHTGEIAVCAATGKHFDQVGVPHGR